MPRRWRSSPSNNCGNTPQSEADGVRSDMLQRERRGLSQIERRRPPEHQAPLIIDPRRMESAPFSLQFLQSIDRRMSSRVSSVMVLPSPERGMPRLDRRFTAPPACWFRADGFEHRGGDVTIGDADGVNEAHHAQHVPAIGGAACRGCFHRRAPGRGLQHNPRRSSPRPTAGSGPVRHLAATFIAGLMHCRRSLAAVPGRC